MNCITVTNLTFGMTKKKGLERDVVAEFHRYLYSSTQETIPKMAMGNLGRKVTSHFHLMKYM